MNIEALKALRDADYPGLSDAEFLAAVNAATVVETVMRATADITNFLMLSGIYAKLLTAYHNTELPQQIRNVAEMAIDLAQSQIFEIELSGAGLQQMLGALVAYGAVTQEESDAITALGLTYKSPAESELGETVTQHHLDCVALLPKLAQAQAQLEIWQSVVGSLANGEDVELP